MHEMLSSLLAREGIAVREGVMLAEYTTLRVGGPARFWVDATCARDIVRSLDAAWEAGLEAHVIGAGSNLLVLDGGIDGLVIHVGDGMAAVEVREGIIEARAGARLSRVAVAAMEAGLGGLEALAGIPGTVGGAVCMNAGAYGAEMSQVLRSATVLDRAGVERELPVEALAMGYRSSAVMARGDIVTRAVFALSPRAREAVAADMRDYARRRREKQPLELPSAGSFFKRPRDGFAGALIEAAGLKGYTVGGAQVSPKHAGFLVNTGGATAADFLALMRQVQRRVLAHSGVMLETEVRILGCDSYC